MEQQNAIVGAETVKLEGGSEPRTDTPTRISSTSKFSAKVCSLMTAEGVSQTMNELQTVSQEIGRNSARNHEIRVMLQRTTTERDRLLLEVKNPEDVNAGLNKELFKLKEEHQIKMLEIMLNLETLQERQQVFEDTCSDLRKELDRTLDTTKRQNTVIQELEQRNRDLEQVVASREEESNKVGEEKEKHAY